MNIVEHLAAEEPDISLRSWWRPKTELQESEYWTYIYIITYIQMNPSASQCLLPHWHYQLYKVALMLFTAC